MSPNSEKMMEIANRFIWIARWAAGKIEVERKRGNATAFHAEVDALVEAYPAMTEWFRDKNAGANALLNVTRAPSVEEVREALTPSIDAALTQERVGWLRNETEGWASGDPLFIRGASEPKSLYGGTYKPLCYATPQPAASITADESQAMFKQAVNAASVASGGDALKWCDTCQVALRHGRKDECTGCTGPDGTMRNWRERWDKPVATAPLQPRTPETMDKLIIRIWLDDMSDDAEPLKITVYGDEKNLKRLEAYHRNPKFAAQPRTLDAPSDELIQLARDIEAMKRECGMDPESPVAIYNGRLMSLSYRLRTLAAGRAATPQQAISEGDWIEHHGTARPVHRDCMVEVKYRNGTVKADKAWNWFWAHADQPTDIVAYRLAARAAQAEGGAA